MQTLNKTILVLAAAVFLLGTGLCLAVEDKPAGKGKCMRLTEEKIERVMNWLAEKNPNRAAELRQLREKNPEKFKAEVRRTWQKQFGPKKAGHRARQRGRGPEGRRADIRPGMKRGPGREGPKGMERVRKHMQQRHRELTGWLEKNYPEEAQKLTELREKHPELYHKRAGLCWRRYHRIMEAQEDNPKVAEVLKEDLELKNQRGKLLKQIKAATDKKTKEKLTTQLEGIVSDRFDLIVKRKQLRYEELSNKLEELKKQVRQSEARVQKLKDSKNKEVKQRLKGLLEEAERIRWD